MTSKTTGRAPWHDAQCRSCRLHFECLDKFPETLCFWCRLAGRG